MTRTSQLRRSGNRLQRQGTLWFQQTKGAGQTFFVESRDAGLTFARDLQSARHRLTTTVTRSTGGLQKALHKEALDWQGLVIKTRGAYVATLRDRIDRAAKAVKAAPTRLVPKSGGAKKKSKPATHGVPLRNYDELTAKDVVSRIQRLSGPQAAAVLEYERARKKRTTVIRAAEQRQAKAS
jgi:hypothetical protein